LIVHPALQVGVSTTADRLMLFVERFSVVIIGIDPRKRTHTASSVDPATNKTCPAPRMFLSEVVGRAPRADR
jgi:hypothetical protein